MPKIKSIEFKEMQETYDLEVEHKDHQFFLSNGILSSNSHAIAYAIDSYYAAWLHTYYETDWLGTNLQNENEKPDRLAKTIAEIKEMGYRIELPDVNESGLYWQWSDKKQAFIPPLTSIKGVGKSAVKEIMTNRPYNTLDDLLFNPDGTWRHSKMNKAAFDALCKIEAFHSIQEMWDGTIGNHRQLHSVIIDNYTTLKKSKWGMTLRKAKKENAEPIISTLIEEASIYEDWSRIDKLNMYQNLCSATRDDLAFPPEMMEKIKNAGVKSVLNMEPGEKCVAWCCIVDMVKKFTKNKKTFYRLKITDYENNTGWLRMWGEKPETMVPYSIWLTEASNDPNWGASTSARKVRPLVVD